MPSRFPIFERARLTTLPLGHRRHNLNLSDMKTLKSVKCVHDELRLTAEAMLDARANGAAIIFMMGAHVIRSGVQRYIIDFMRRGLVTCLAGNGACAVHDFELALIGATTESVADYIKIGQFGLWDELELLNKALLNGVKHGWGAGECVGRLIDEGSFPHADISLFAAAWRFGIPFTVHIGIGNDIIHQLPSCNGAAIGQASYTDFLIFANKIENLEGGVYTNFGSAVTGPEVYLKALSMARNVSGGDRRPRQFTTLVCDLHDLPQNVSQEADKQNPLYYYRPWKTILARTLNEGVGYYVKGCHDYTVPALWTAIGEAEKAG